MKPGTTAKNAKKVLLPATTPESMNTGEPMEIDTDGVELQNGVTSEESLTQARGKRKAGKPAIKEDDSDEEPIPKVCTVLDGLFIRYHRPTDPTSRENDKSL